MIDSVKSVTELGNRVGLEVGGKDIDPVNKNLTRPAAWVIYVGDDVEESNDRSPCGTLVRLNFVVKVLIDRDNEATQISTNLPLLHKVVSAVRGTDPLSSGSKVVYEGQVLEELTNERMVWEQNYSILISIT
jgi:hypothetical protein